MSLDVTLVVVKEVPVFNGNITSNLMEMAEKAGIDKHLWEPETIPILRAKDLIEPLSEGLVRLQTAPKYFKRYESDNGWGTYQDLCDFLKSYIEACNKYPLAKIATWK